ncbi:DNA-directed RNA polymerase subunit delta [Aerococcaceae bacterium DSM 109653]|uniref:Probable DNA-directed RNA polymerase subunit delta n=1 Tax=Fundicoccus ignavus TaxID=2664442 RepID=A0A6I2G992_9LACT|nr:DNA-directed RNA polymerase subunit delta [Fundicoccus ignavus]MRI81607.1 DNA-directed RNA polymerase subunit delta [Fundicoccus ignavus]MRI84350.1 DNA-directed RNA polymerase subunit delta [Fundicoccus ignavus]
MELKQFTGINKEELSMIEVAHAILENKGSIVDFADLLVTIQEYLGFNDSELETRMTRFYTDINIDGRFISLGDNRWGLRAWYAIDEIDEEIITSAEEEETPKRKLKKKRKLNAFADSDDMIDYNDDDPEDIDGIYDEEDDSFDEDEDDEEDDTANLNTIIDPDAEEEDDEELGEYKSDLTELGDEEIELDDDEEIELDEDEEDEEENEDYDEEEFKD